MLELIKQLEDYTTQLKDGLITEPEWLTKMIEALMKRNLHLKRQAAKGLQLYFQVAVENPMTSRELKTAILAWADVNYYLFEDPAGSLNPPA